VEKKRYPLSQRGKKSGSLKDPDLEGSKAPGSIPKGKKWAVNFTGLQHGEMKGAKKKAVVHCLKSQGGVLKGEVRGLMVVLSLTSRERAGGKIDCRTTGGGNEDMDRDSQVGLANRGRGKKNVP